MTAANKDFFEALSMLEHERGITAEYLKIGRAHV